MHVSLSSLSLIVETATALLNMGHACVLVTSGSVGLGCVTMGLTERPKLPSSSPPHSPSSSLRQSSQKVDSNSSTFKNSRSSSAKAKMQASVVAKLQALSAIGSYYLHLNSLIYIYN